MCESDTQLVLDLALKTLQVSVYEIAETQEGGKEDGYGSKITYVTIAPSTNPDKPLHLVIKAVMPDPKLRKIVPFKAVFDKEIFIYTSVKSTFENLLNEYATQTDPIDFLAPCHATRSDEPHEALVFQNLKPQGYALLDKTKPWPWPATVLSLRTYGRLHGLSFALKAKNREKFDELTHGITNMFSEIVRKMNLIGAMGGEFEKQKDRCIGEGRQDVAKYLNYNREDVLYALTDMFFENLDHRVILHGDCWSNNFLFKYESGAPVNVCILDWQCSGFGSPAFDLSHLIYATANTAEHADIREYLDIYYESLSRTLRLFHCDPQDIYSYDQLLADWKRFSKFGLFLSPFIKKVCFVGSADNPDLSAIGDGGSNIESMYGFTVQNGDYHLQINANFAHYCRNVQ